MDESNTIVKFRARLLSAPTNYPHCGDDKIAVGFRFQLIPKKDNLSDEVVVILACPEQYGDSSFFREKDIFIIKANRLLKKQDDYTILNSFANDKLATWWGLDITKNK